jgi:hypothetical protein
MLGIAGQPRDAEARVAARPVAATLAALSDPACQSMCINSCPGPYVTYWDGLVSPGSAQDTCDYMPPCSYCYQEENNEQDYLVALADIKNAADNRDARRLVALITARTKVRFNAERQSVQVVGCDQKSIVANIPVTADVAATLGALQH